MVSMSAYWKDLFREIKNTPGRFFSLILIAVLGAASIVGIQATSIDMRNIADKTYKEQNLYDIQIKSTVGFDEDDITALAGAPGISAVMPTYSVDVFILIENENRTVRTYALPDGINAIKVLDGRLPENPRECAIEQSMSDDSKINIGGSIRLDLDDMDDYNDVFTGDTFTVVGIVASPLYITFQRGNTTLGNGSLNYYLYLHPDAYKLDVFTDIYILMDGSHAIHNLTTGYYETADGWKRQIEQTGDLRVQAKKDKLADAQKEIDDGWAEYYDGLKELEEETAKGRRELADAKIELDDAKSELESGQITLDEKIAEGLAEIEKQAEELTAAQDEIYSRSAELSAAQAEITRGREQLGQALAELALQGPQGVSPILDAYYEQIYTALAQLDQKQAELNEGKAALRAAQKRVDEGLVLLDEARAKLEEERQKAQQEIDDSWIEYYKGVDEYESGLIRLEKEEADGLAELANAKRELEEAQEQLDKAPEPEWFFFTRKDGVAFDSYYQDTLRLEKIGYVFPMVFFLVAVMVSLTTMSRMVEDQRTQIGVYKALGYRPAAILMKYLIYAFTAGITGGILGAVLGNRILPQIIADAYGHLYDMPPIETPIPVTLAAAAVLSAVFAVVIVTLGTYLGSMRGSPALLMRPKPPAKGKRVFLERIVFIWNRLGFFSKVTARNTFRYKKRFFMTLAGVAGCSALLLTAFGLRDSISSVADLQFKTIIKYDARAYLKDVTSDDERGALDSLLPTEHLFIREETMTANGPEGGLSASLIIPDDPDRLTGFYNLRSPETKTPVEMTGRSVLVTDKLSRVMGVGPGGSFTIRLSDGRIYTAEITGVVDNYLLHYVYMSPAVYSELFNEEFYPNSALIFYENGRDSVSTLLENENIRALIHNDEIESRVGEQSDAMGIVTIVLIVLACALAFVVLFNLTNINISERIRELATMKVLGLNDTELAMYIYRENGVVTLLGIVIGLVGGIYLHSYVLRSVEIDILKFPKIITPQSYVYAVVISIAFAVFVNLIMSIKLRKIDMVESLKNVE